MITKTITISKILVLLEAMAEEEHPLRVMDIIDMIRKLLVDEYSEQHKRYHTSGEVK